MPIAPRFLRCGALALALCLAGGTARAGLFDRRIDPKDLAGIKPPGVELHTLKPVTRARIP
jgi:hypothetical protein